VFRVLLARVIALPRLALGFDGRRAPSSPPVPYFAGLVFHQPPVFGSGAAGVLAQPAVFPALFIVAQESGRLLWCFLCETAEVLTLSRFRNVLSTTATSSMCWSGSVFRARIRTH
jgi:hypothetical protein